MQSVAPGRIRFGIVLTIGLLVFGAVWLLRAPSVHPEFGPFHRAHMSESPQNLWQKATAHMRRWLHLSPALLQSPNDSDYGLHVGPALLGWSIANNAPPKRDGYVYLCDVRPSEKDAPLWEIALTTKQRLGDVTRDDLQCEFYGKNDARGTNVFGAAWNGRAIRVPEGQVLFARVQTNRSVVYVIRLAKQGGSQHSGTMEIEYLAVTNQPPNHQSSERAGERP